MPEKPRSPLPSVTPRAGSSLRAHAVNEMSTVTEESIASSTTALPPVPPPPARSVALCPRPQSQAMHLKSQSTGPATISRRQSFVIPAALAPQVTGLQRQTTELQSQPTGHQPQVFGLQPQASGPQPQATGLQPQAMGLRPQVTGFQPQLTGSQSQVSGLHSQETGRPQANSATGVWPQPTGATLQPHPAGPAGYQQPVPSAPSQQTGYASVPAQPTGQSAAPMDVNPKQHYLTPVYPLPPQTSGRLAASSQSQRSESFFQNRSPALPPQAGAGPQQQPPRTSPFQLQRTGTGVQPQGTGHNWRQSADQRAPSLSDRTHSSHVPFPTQSSGPPAAPWSTGQFLHPPGSQPSFPGAGYPATAVPPGGQQWTYPASQPLQRSATGPVPGPCSMQQPWQSTHTGPAYPAGAVPAHMRRQSTGAYAWNQPPTHHRTMSDNPGDRRWGEIPRPPLQRGSRSNTLRLFGINRPREKSVSIATPGVDQFGSERRAARTAS